MSLIVYVWNPVDRMATSFLNGNWLQMASFSSSTSSAGGLGHASLQAGASYISLWPPVEKDSKPFSASKNYNHDVYERIRRKPEHIIRLDNLPDLEVRTFWFTFSTPFNEINNNCCHVVARSLHIAKNEYLLKHKRQSLSQVARKTVSNLGMNYLSATGSIIWSPGLVTNFALALKLWSSKG